MPVQTKDKLLQVRIDQELYDRFSIFADSKNATVSAAVRGVMRHYVEQFEVRARKDAEWAATLASRAAAARSTEVAQKSPVGPVDRSEGYVLPHQTRAQRRKAERDAAKGR